MQRSKLFIKEAFSGIPAVVWLLALVTLINRAGTMVIPFLPLYVHDELGFSYSFAGLAVSLFGLGALVGSWWGGFLSDHFNPFSVLMTHLFGSGLLLFILEHLRTPLLLTIGLISLGIISEAIRPCIAVLLTQSCSKALRPRGFTLYRLAVNLGMVMGPAIGGIMALKDYAWLFRIDGLTCLVAVLPMLLLPQGRSIRNLQSAKPRSSSVKSASALRDKQFLCFLVLVILVGCMFLQLWSSYPIFLKVDLGLNERHYGLCMSLSGVLIIGCEMLLTHYFSRWHPLRVMIAGVFILGIGLGMLPFGYGLAYALFSVVIWSLGEMLLSPFMSTYAANRANEDNIGQYMGLYSMSFSLAFILGPLLGTRVYEHFGGTVLWVSIFGLGLVCMAGFYLLYRFEKAEDLKRQSNSNPTSGPEIWEFPL